MHTKEPWVYGNVRNGVTSLMRPDAEQEAIDIYPEDDARRIVACVNACAGLSTNDLERTGLVSAVGYEIERLQQQRDELLEALKQFVDAVDRDVVRVRPSEREELINIFAQANEAIAKVEAEK